MKSKKWISSKQVWGAGFVALALAAWLGACSPQHRRPPNNTKGSPPVADTAGDPDKKKIKPGDQTSAGYATFKDVQDQLDKLHNLSDDIQKQTQPEGASDTAQGLDLLLDEKTEELAFKDADGKDQKLTYVTDFDDKNVQDKLIKPINGLMEAKEKAYAGLSTDADKKKARDALSALQTKVQELIVELQAYSDKMDKTKSLKVKADDKEDAVQLEHAFVVAGVKNRLSQIKDPIKVRIDQAFTEISKDAANTTQGGTKPSTTESGD